MFSFKFIFEKVHFSKNVIDQISLKYVNNQLIFKYKTIFFSEYVT
jgi:hypothetical protein